MPNTIDVHGIKYTKPTVILMQDTGIGVAEYAARTCYDSFDKSENSAIAIMDTFINNEKDHMSNSFLNMTYDDGIKHSLNNTEHSDLLDRLAWVNFHHSVLEHANLSYLIKGTSRGVLQEHARHRIQSISVRSTRYTLSPIINAFNACESFEQFYDIVSDLDFLVVTGIRAKLDIEYIYKALEIQFNTLGNEFLNISASKEQKEILLSNQYLNAKSLYNRLNKAKQKRNVGDAFKHIVTDNFKVDLVCTFNLRSLKNYLELRSSGAAYFQIQWITEAMKEVTPSKYLDLILKEK